MAQLAEQLICNQQVIGSSPIIGFLKILYFHNGWIPEWPKAVSYTHLMAGTILVFVLIYLLVFLKTSKTYYKIVGEQV